MKQFLGGFFGVLTVLVLFTHEISPHRAKAQYPPTDPPSGVDFTRLSMNYALGQTGPTGPTGATGATGGTGAAGTVTYNGHTLFGGSAPTVTECGGNPTLETGSNDNAGGINVGTSSKPATVCTITFAAAFTHAPAMSFTTSKNQVLASPLTISTTAVRFRLSSDMSGGVITYSAF